MFEREGSMVFRSVHDGGSWIDGWRDDLRPTSLRELAMRGTVRIPLVQGSARSQVSSPARTTRPAPPWGRGRRAWRIR
jgi:hypothetical protein